MPTLRQTLVAQVRAAPPMPTGPFVNPMEEPMPPKAILLVAPVSVFFFLALVCLGLRFWAKRLKKAALRLSDYSIIVAIIFSAGYFSIVVLVSTRGGVGFEIERVGPNERAVTQKSFIVAWLLQACANSFVRLSILDFMVSIFAIRKFRIAAYFFEACTVAYLLSCIIAFLASCRPIEYNFTVGPKGTAQCGNLPLKFLLSTVFNLILDVCILILPMPVLWTLKLNMQKKIALTFVFGLGIFVVFATAWRTHHVIIFNAPAVKRNYTMNIVEDALWSGLEINLGIINACLPIIPPALSRIFQTSFIRRIASAHRTIRTNKSMATSSRRGIARGDGISRNITITMQERMYSPKNKDGGESESLDSATNLTTHIWSPPQSHNPYPSRDNRH